MPIASGTTLLISLGGGRYPRAKKLRNAAFERSSKALASFLTVGLGSVTTPSLHLNLFDDDRAWSEQVIAMRDWLRERIPATPADDGSTRVDNVLIHFVGHGMMRPGSEEHYLSINATDADDRILTSASLGNLNAMVLKNAPRRRRIYLVDACFAAASVRDLMGPTEEAIEVTLGSVLGAWPEDRWGASGVAALCSADRYASASAGGERNFTQFTDGLLHVLEMGDSVAPERLSLRRVHALLGRALSSRYGENAVQPLLVAPEDSEGGIAGAPLFANLAVGGATRGWPDRPPRSEADEDETAPEPHADGTAAEPRNGLVDRSLSSAPSSGNVVQEPASTGPNGWEEQPADLGPVGQGGTVSPEQRFRQAVYRFFRLPHSRKEEIAGKFDPAGTYKGLPDLDRYKAVLSQVRDKGAVGRLEGLIVEAEMT